MKLCMIGTGYVGLVSGVCFADLGNEVICVDKDLNKISSLKKGKVPIYEPGLSELVFKNFRNKRLNFYNLITYHAEFSFLSLNFMLSGLSSKNSSIALDAPGHFFSL